MYKCKECGEIFEEPVGLYDKVPYGEGSVECCTGSESPCCGAGYEEVETCKCGEVVFKHNLCKYCYDEALDQMKKLWREMLKLSKQYDIDEDDLVGLLEDAMDAGGEE